MYEVNGLPSTVTSTRFADSFGVTVTGNGALAGTVAIAATMNMTMRAGFISLYFRQLHR